MYREKGVTHVTEEKFKARRGDLRLENSKGGLEGYSILNLILWMMKLQMDFNGAHGV